MAILVFGGRLLVVEDPLPDRATVVVVLNGSSAANEARQTEAMRLLRNGRAEYVLLSIGAVSYWGEWVPDLARRYLRERYGRDVADKIHLCEMNTDSTAEEAMELRECMEKNGWRSAVIVTSNYHTRRAHAIWRSTVSGANPPFHLTVHGVSDGSFSNDGWWRSRVYAKTWLVETTKLVWTTIELIASDGSAQAR